MANLASSVNGTVVFIKDVKFYDINSLFDGNFCASHYLPDWV